VRQVILQGLPPSLLLGAAAMLWALLIGLPAGMGAAKARGTWIDSLLTTLSSLGMAIPNFVLAGLLLLLLVFHFRVFSPAGLLTPADLILPSFTLGVPFAAQVARLFRTGMLDVLGQDWIRTAHAKGLSPRRVLLTQALLPASIPVITFLGPALAGILTGSLVIEQVFAIPGLGTHFVQGALNRDYTLSLGMVVLFTALVSFLNLLSDALVAAIDPRVKLQ
jgi:oligopeptide transport system permease protein